MAIVAGGSVDGVCTSGGRKGQRFMPAGPKRKGRGSGAGRPETREGPEASHVDKIGGAGDRRGGARSALISSDKEVGW